RERWSTSKQTNAVTKILQKSVNRSPAPHLHRNLFYKSNVSKFARGFVFGFVSVFAAIDFFLPTHPDMAFNFFTQFALPFAPVQKVHACIPRAVKTAVIALLIRSQCERSDKSCFLPAAVR